MKNSMLEQHYILLAHSKGSTANSLKGAFKYLKNCRPWQITSEKHLKNIRFNQVNSNIAAHQWKQQATDWGLWVNENGMKTLARIANLKHTPLRGKYNSDHVFSQNLRAVETRRFFRYINDYEVPSFRVVVAHDNALILQRGAYGKIQSTTNISVLRHKRNISHLGCLSTDLFSIKHKNHFVRYDFNGKRTGVAIDMPMDLRMRFTDFEHGRNLTECRENIQRKYDILASNAKEVKFATKQERKVRLFARLSNKAAATLSDAVNAGYCMAGITAWLESRGLAGISEVPLCQLAHDSDRRAVSLSIQVARNILASNSTH